MRCARRIPRLTTRATVRCGSSLSPAVTSLAAALVAALVAEPASRSTGRSSLPHELEPPGCARGLFLRTAIANSGARIHFDAVALMSARRESTPAVIAYLCGESPLRVTDAARIPGRGRGSA